MKTGARRWDFRQKELNIRQKELRKKFVFKKLSNEGKGKSEKDGRGLLKTLTALDESASHKDEQVWGNYNKNA